jgi:hypothetical protein
MDDDKVYNISSYSPSIQAGDTHEKILVQQCFVYGSMEAQSAKLWTLSKTHDGDEDDSLDQEQIFSSSIHDIVSGLGLFPSGRGAYDRDDRVYDVRMFYRLLELQSHSDISIESFWESIHGDYDASARLRSAEPHGGSDSRPFVTKKAFTSAFQHFVRSLVGFHIAFMLALKMIFLSVTHCT